MFKQTTLCYMQKRSYSSYSHYRNAEFISFQFKVILMTGQNYCNDQAVLIQCIHSYSQVSFNPQDNTQICVSGNGVFKIFRFAGETLKQSSTFKTDSQNFLCHTWISTEKVIAGTETGQLMMFESCRLRWETSVASVQKVKR